MSMHMTCRPKLVGVMHDLGAIVKMMDILLPHEPFSSCRYMYMCMYVYLYACKHVYMYMYTNVY